jgi:hypothetical protein
MYEYPPPPHTHTHPLNLQLNSSLTNNLSCPDFGRRRLPGVIRFLVTWWPLQQQICNGLTIGEALFAAAWITAMLMGSYSAQHNPKKLGHLAGLPFILVWQLACRNSIWCVNATSLSPLPAVPPPRECIRRGKSRRGGTGFPHAGM